MKISGPELTARHVGTVESGVKVDEIAWPYNRIF